MLAIRLGKLLKEQEEQIKNRDESLEKAREEIKWLRGMLKEQETKWIHREDLDFKDKLGCNHFHGMCENCGFIHDFIDDHTGQYKYCPQCGRVVKWE